MDYIKIDNDAWADCEKVWGVISYTPRTGSTAVNLVLEDTNTNEVVHRVVASHQIEWLEAKDW